MTAKVTHICRKCKGKMAPDAGYCRTCFSAWQDKHPGSSQDQAPGPVTIRYTEAVTHG